MDVVLSPVNTTLFEAFMRKGFSLVELSIVLVIIGLLAGGIMMGQSLMRNAEIKSVISERDKYLNATKLFKSKYGQLPGDMPDATAVWSTTVNGDEDGILDNAAAVSVTGEMFQFWNQLSLAGFIEGTYTGLAGADADIGAVIGTNVPKATISTGGWTAYYNGTSAGSGLSYAAVYNHTFTFGSKIAASITAGPLLTPEEAWNIDTKIDDGKPGRGAVLPRSSIAWSTTGSCTTSTGNTDYAGDYNLNSKTASCGLWFIKQF